MSMGKIQLELISKATNSVAREWIGNKGVGMNMEVVCCALFAFIYIAIVMLSGMWLGFLFLYFLLPMPGLCLPVFVFAIVWFVAFAVIPGFHHVSIGLYGLNRFAGRSGTGSACSIMIRTVLHFAGLCFFACAFTKDVLVDFSMAGCGSAFYDPLWPTMMKWISSSYSLENLVMFMIWAIPLLSFAFSVFLIIGFQSEQFVSRAYRVWRAVSCLVILLPYFIMGTAGVFLWASNLLAFAALSQLEGKVEKQNKSNEARR